MQQCQLDLNPVIVATLGALAVDDKVCVAPAPSHPAVGTLGARVRPSLLAPSAPRSGPTHSLLARAGDVYPCRAVYPGSHKGPSPLLPRRTMGVNWMNEAAVGLVATSG
jgi:hypothetical protein